MDLKNTCSCYFLRNWSLEYLRMTAFALGDVTYKIIGAAMRVHGTPGNGLPEVFYQERLRSNL